MRQEECRRAADKRTAGEREGIDSFLRWKSALLSPIIGDISFPSIRSLSDIRVAI
jgi:hypothetical protein